MNSVIGLPVISVTVGAKQGFGGRIIGILPKGAFLVKDEKAGTAWVRDADELSIPLSHFLESEDK